jgi:dephospho-CoA kinase
MVKRIGLTGGIACGKSTVGQMLISLGFPVIDADTVVHDTLATHQAVRTALMKRFGNTVFDIDTQAMDRKALAARIFSDEDDKRMVEGLLHPIVREAIQQFFSTNQHTSLAFALVPLIFETRTESLYDEVWCITSTEALQIERLQQARGMRLEDVHARLKNQMPLKEKMKRAHRTLHNHLDLNHLNMEVDRCIRECLLNQATVELNDFVRSYLQSTK